MPANDLVCFGDVFLGDFHVVNFCGSGHEIEAVGFFLVFEGNNSGIEVFLCDWQFCQID
jgi:hypothetical protein